MTDIKTAETKPAIEFEREQCGNDNKVVERL